MLPGHIVGSVKLSAGWQPFRLDTPTGAATLGAFADVDPAQRRLGAGERRAVERQLRTQLDGLRQVRVGQIKVGEYRCPACDRWVAVARDPDAWSGDRCARCAG